MPLTTIPNELPAVHTDVVIFTVQEARLDVLLTQRRHQPFAGHWSLPGGFVRIEESLEQAARRVLAEQTGTRQLYLEQLYTFGAPRRDLRARIISVAYFALASADKVGNTSQDNAWVAWHPAFDPPLLAFDHGEIVAYAIERLRYKLEYTAAAFQLLPEQFTLRELQNAYEVILRESLDKRNFRRKILSTQILEATDDYRYGDHRPARLYRFSHEAKFEGQARRLFP
ncbi:MAG: NUDIX hydrolase [Ardenticatenales bacterium]|nr:NUDIX hydrolase [Ardenticatenales bacterium]